MGMSLKELKKRSPVYDPEAKTLHEAYLERQLLGEDGGDPEVGEGCLEQDFVCAVDLLDAYHILLVQIVNDWKFDKKFEARLAEARDEIGEFLDKVHGPEGSQKFLM